MSAVPLRPGSRRTPHGARVAAQKLGGGLVVAALVLAGCGDDDSGDLAAFCVAVEDLREDDPFAGLDVASPGEMRDAFAELADGVDRIATVAPPEVGSQADRYADAVDALRDELGGAGYDPTRVDQLPYGQAVAAYTEAAVSVDNAADALC